VGEGGTVLGFELVGQDQISASEDVFVGWDDVFVDVEAALVAHYWVEDFSSGDIF
jgi:hypothetical protein